MIPAQYRSSSTAGSRYLGTLLTYSDMDLRVYYNSDVTEKALIGPASIAKVRSEVNPDGSISLRIQATEPRLGVHELWVLYTGLKGSGLHGEWQLLDLGRNQDEVSEWRGTISAEALGSTDPSAVRFFVQAVNAVGKVTLDANNGQYYQPNADPADLSSPPTSSDELIETELTFTAPSTGAFSDVVEVEVILVNKATQEPLPNQVIHVSIGDLTFDGLTDSNGEAKIIIPIVSLPDPDEDELEIQVDYEGSADFDEALARKPFIVTKQPTALAFAGNVMIEEGEPWMLQATLTDGEGRAIPERFIRFTLRNITTNQIIETAIDTNQAGQAILNSLIDQELPEGNYEVEASFAEDEYYLGSTAEATLSSPNAGPIVYKVYLPVIFR